MEGKFLTQKLRGNLPDQPKIVLEKHLVEPLVDLAESTSSRLEAFPHLVVLLIAAASAEAEQLFGGEQGGGVTCGHRVLLLNPRLRVQ